MQLQIFQKCQHLHSCLSIQSWSGPYVKAFLGNQIFLLKNAINMLQNVWWLHCSIWKVYPVMPFFFMWSVLQEWDEKRSVKLLHVYHNLIYFFSFPSALNLSSSPFHLIQKMYSSYFLENKSAYRKKSMWWDTALGRKKRQFGVLKETSKRWMVLVK